MSIEHEFQPAIEAKAPLAPKVLGTINVLACAALWIGLGFAIYFLLPRARQVFEDFGTELPLLTVWTIRYMGLILPVIAAISAVGFMKTHSRPARWVMAFGVPVFLFCVLTLTIGMAIVKLLEDLS